MATNSTYPGTADALTSTKRTVEDPSLVRDHARQHDRANDAIDAVQTWLGGVGATGSRPSAASVANGAGFYDTTLHKPIWSDGTNWRDAMANVV